MKKPKKETVKSELKKTISITLDIDLVKELDKRARKNYMSLREMMEDILRRSMVSYNKGSRSSAAEPKVEKFVQIFSRKRRGRKKQS